MPRTGWPKSLFSVFCKTKDTFVMLTSTFIDLDTWGVSVVSRVAGH